MNDVIIGFGSNIEPAKNLMRTRRALEEAFELRGESKFIETEPIDQPAQPKFLNGVFVIRTELDMTQLKKRLCAIEAQLGRDRSLGKAEPRPVDLDILVWNGEIVDAVEYERTFVKNAIREVRSEL